jgi:AraC-like DNA-binding protein
MAMRTHLAESTRIFHPTYVRLLCLFIREHGVPLADALAGSGLTWRQLLNERRLVPFESMRSLVLAAKRLTGRPSLGLEWGVSVEAAAHGLTGTAISASRDLSEALQSVARYRPLRGRALEFDLVRRGEGATLIMREPFDFGDIRSFVLEAHAGIVARSVATVAGLLPVGIEYRFPYPPPAWAPEYARWLRGAIRFRAKRMELSVPNSVLRLPGMLVDARTEAAIVIPAERELALQQSGREWIGRIRQRLLEQQGTYPGVNAMARKLNISPRTLLRKLRQEGATYQVLLDDARKEVAEWYLVRTREPIEAIAERLGYADPSNFSRSFRRWFGTPPTKFRRARRDSD